VRLMLDSDFDRVESPGLESLEPFGTVVGERRSEQKRVDPESHECVLTVWCGNLLLERRYLTIKARLAQKLFWEVQADKRFTGGR